tara:strand:+ start:270 stop:683 length:414 start_codon:yes stop_codon:yes gene_type:complete
MKNFTTFLTVLAFWFTTMAGMTISNPDEAEVREPRYLTEANFDEAINTGVVIVEFVASFAEPFEDWEQVEKEGPYYRVDIEKYPSLKKKYKIRVIPTILVFNNGFKELSYRANIMLELDVTASEIHQDIEDIFNDKF